MQAELRAWLDSQLVRSLRSKYRERWVRKQTDLLEHRRLIPVDALVCELAVAKSDNQDKWNLDAAAGWRKPGSIYGISVVWVLDYDAGGFRA
jgi:hypothetical protein